MPAAASGSYAIPHRSAVSHPWVFIPAALVAFLVLAIGYSLTRAPWWDEGVYADIAMTFRNHGYLGAMTFSPFGYLNLPGAHRYTYSQLPLYLITLGGGWWRVFPASVESMRLFSVFWGCVYIASWFFVVRALSHRDSLAFFVACVVALDYSCIAAASDGRMDMMCAALGQAGLASYVCLRESNWNRAIMLAGWFGAASLFCHPMGIVSNVSIAAVALLDWRRFRWKGFAGAALPYLLGTAACVAYILEAPAVFWAQAKAASGYRVTGLLPILHNLLNDFYFRYVGLYYSSLSGINRLKAASLIFVVAGTIGLAVNRRLRSQPLGRVLLILAGVGYLGVAAIDNQKIPVYFIYSMPAMAACGALWVWDSWKRGGFMRLFAGALLTGSVLASVGGFTYKIHSNQYEHLYRPAIAAIKTNLTQSGLVMGGSELGFALGFERLIDDRYLGYFSRKIPDVYVENAYYGGPSGPDFVPAWEWSRNVLRTQYHLVFENSAFAVYAHNAR